MSLIHIRVHLRTYFRDARAGIIEWIAVGVVGLAAKVVLSLSTWALLSTIAAAGALLYLVGGPRRHRQRTLEDIREDTSSSASAFKLVEYVKRSILAGLSKAQILRDITRVTARRRYPATFLVRPIVEMIEQSEASSVWRKKAIRQCEAVERERSCAREKTVELTAAFLSGLEPTTDFVVLSGYSSTVCESIIRHADPDLVVLVVEDLQYGVDSAREHELVEKVLHAAGLACHVIPFGELDALVGSAFASIPTFGGRRISLPQKRRLVALLGCDAIGLDGSVLIPATIAGAPSDSACLAEAFVQQRRGRPLNNSRQLVIVGESYKVASADAFQELSSSAPLRRGWSVRLLHRLGIAAHDRVDPTSLYRICTGWSAILTDAGAVLPGLQVQQDLSRMAKAWADRVADQSLPVRLQQVVSDVRL